MAALGGCPITGINVGTPLRSIYETVGGVGMRWILVGCVCGKDPESPGAWRIDQPRRL